MTKGIFICDGCGDHEDDDDGLIVHELDSDGYVLMTCLVCAGNISTEQDLAASGIILNDEEEE